MKKIIIVSFFLTLLATESFSQFIKKPSVEIGYCYHKNSLNEEKYLAYKYFYFHDNPLAGLNLKFTFPTEISYLDLVVGSLFEKTTSTYQNDSWNIGIVKAIDYVSNGGGVYIGISPKLKGKHFGLTSEFSIGVLSYKEYASIYNNVVEPYFDENIRKASYGLGAISSVGFYVKAGRLMFNPGIQAVFSGGDQSSFLFYGLNLPLVYQF
ncbi:MAG: hypothetical protein ACERKD_20490 [Prolixibacteraceae bacterium]